jgi:hypothetical protein
VRIGTLIIGVIASCSGVAEIVTVFPLLVSSSTMCGVEVAGLEVAATSEAVAVPVATGVSVTSTIGFCGNSGAEDVADVVATGSAFVGVCGFDPPPPTSNTGATSGVEVDVEMSGVEVAATDVDVATVD